MSRRPVLRVAMLVAFAGLLAGCRLDVIAGLEVDRDGAGTASVTVTVDRELLAELDALAVDPTAELQAAVDAQDPADGWTVARRATDDGGLSVEVARPASTPDELTTALRELSTGLSEDDPALVLDLDLDVAADGAADLSGTATLRAPAGPGVVDDPEATTAEELAAVTADAVTASLRVTLPGRPGAHDADEVVGTQLTWVVPLGEERTITASAAAPTGPPRELVVGAAVGVLGVTALAVVVVRRRARRRG